MKKIAIIVSFCFVFLFTAYAQWSTDPNNNLIVGYGLLPEIASDNAGGCYITYEQNLAYPRRLTLERLDRYGYKPWGTGKRILGELPEQSFAKITEDGNNGVIVSYLDIEMSGDPHGPGKMRLRLQRVDSSGNFLWGPTGVRVTLWETNQANQAIVSDGTGGCIVAWRDTLKDLRLQRIDSSGMRLWGDSGLHITNEWNGAPSMIPDERGGVILGWGGGRFQRVNKNGQNVWPDSGITIVPGYSKMVSDGCGGAVLAGMIYLSYNNGDPYWRAICQRIDSNGVVLWGNDGIILEDSLQNIVTNPPGITLATNIDGGATFAWQKRVRTGTLRSFTQRIRENGTFIFPDSARQVSAVDSAGNGTWSIITSANDSKIYVVADGRPNKPLVGQRIDSSGVRLWYSSDVTISSRSLGYVKVISDGNDGTIIVGFDQSDFSIRIQQCSRDGNLAEVITDINDNETEYRVRVFRLSQNYPNPFNPITRIAYSIPEDAFVQLKVYNILGQEVITLVNEHKQQGEHEVFFDAKNLPSGVYYYKLTSGLFTSVKKMLLIR